MKFAKTIICTKEALPMDILPLFCDIDDFCLFFEPLWKQRLLSSGERQRERAANLCLSEVMTIIVLFHTSSYRNFHGLLHRAGHEALRRSVPTLGQLPALR